MAHPQASALLRDQCAVSTAPRARGLGAALFEQLSSHLSQRRLECPSLGSCGLGEARSSRISSHQERQGHPRHSADCKNERTRERLSPVSGLSGARVAMPGPAPIPESCRLPTDPQEEGCWGTQGGSFIGRVEGGDKRGSRAVGACPSPPPPAPPAVHSLTPPRGSHRPGPAGTEAHSQHSTRPPSQGRKRCRDNRSTQSLPAAGAGRSMAAF